MTKAKCPACDGMDIVFIRDDVHDKTIFKCRRCGEAYAANNFDIDAIGPGVFEEWRRGYESQRRLEGGERWL